MTIKERLGEVAAMGEEFASFVESLTPTALHHRLAPGEWSAAEIAGHVAESPLFHATTIRRLLDDPATPFGRGADDPARLAAVESLAGAEPDAAAAALRRTFADVLAILTTLPAEAWQVRGRHIRSGEQTVAEVVEGSIIQHVRDHLSQARAAAGA